MLTTIVPSTSAQPVATSSLPNYITIFKAWRHGETESNKKQLITGGGPDDALGMTALNAAGKKQAEKLGQLIVQGGPLDVIYTSDTSRALETAKAVSDAFEKNGQSVQLRLSKQLREILHGQFELTPAESRDRAASSRIQELLDTDQRQLTDKAELKDKYRFWKIHPLVSNDQIVPEPIVDVEQYLQSQETRPETPYQLWQRVNQEFIRIALEHPGATVGISTHAAVLGVLIGGMANCPEGSYLPPYYNKKEFKLGEQIVIPVAPKIENCALIYFKYDARDGGKLELYEPEKS